MKIMHYSCRHNQKRSKMPILLVLEAPSLRGFYFAKMKLKVQLTFIDVPFDVEGGFNS
jgi:hypothetical protein